LAPDTDFVLESELKELGVGKAAAGGLLETHAECRRHAGQPELL
jgi:hypothetical protein